MGPDSENVEGSFEDVERDAESLQEQTENLERREQELSDALSKLEADTAVVRSLQNTEQELEQEREELEGKREDALAKLVTIEDALKAIEEQNEGSDSDLDLLRELGVDVSEADSIIGDRRRWLEECYARVEELRRLLGEDYASLGNFSPSGKKGLQEFAESDVEGAEESKEPPKNPNDEYLSSPNPQTGDLPFVEKNLKKAASLAGKHYLSAELLSKLTGMFKNYVAHTDKHIKKVYEKVAETFDVLGGMDLPEGYASLSGRDKMSLLVAALFHDTGMDGNRDVLKAVCGPDVDVDAILDKGGSKGEALIRKNHGLCSALNVLANREALESIKDENGNQLIDVDQVALDCAIHSKSGSGVKNIQSSKQWQGLVSRIAESSARGGMTFDTSKFMGSDGKIAPEALRKGASHAVCMRVADANGHDMHSTELQNGDKRIVDRNNFVGSAAAQSRSRHEILSNKVYAQSSDGTRREVKDRFSKMYALGEGNIRSMSVTSKGGTLVERVTVDRGAVAPECTMSCVKERAYELATARGLKTSIEVTVNTSGLSEDQIKSLHRRYERNCLQIEQVTSSTYHHKVKVSYTFTSDGK